MRDRDVRRALTGELEVAHAGDPNTLIREELGLEHGEVFVDVAVINGEIHGYELKSERDTLERLPHQVAVYNAVLDKATLVVAESHLKAARALVSPWWGLQKAVSCAGGTVRLERVREARRNPRQRALSVAKLLWRDEVLEVLEAHDAARGVRSKPRKLLYERLANLLSPEKLREEVRVRLKRRDGW